MKDVEVVPLNGDGLKRMQEFPLTDLLLLVAAGLLAFQIFGREGRKRDAEAFKHHGAWREKATPRPDQYGKYLRAFVRDAPLWK